MILSKNVAFVIIGNNFKARSLEMGSGTKKEKKKRVDELPPF